MVQMRCVLALLGILAMVPANNGEIEAPWIHGELAKLHRAADVDGDGLATSAELVHLLHHKRYAKTAHNAKALHDFGDSQGDGDGFLTLDELVLAHGGSGGEQEVRDFLAAADKNPQDGKLSLSEVESQMRVTWAEHEEGAMEEVKTEVDKVFAAADVDVNGQLTPDELQNGWENNLFSESAKSILAFAMHEHKLNDEL